MSLQKAVLLIIGVIAFVILMTMLAGKVQAEGVVVGPDCRITWNPGTDGGPVEGFRVYVGESEADKTPRTETTSTESPCSALGLSDGQQYVHVTA